MTSDNYMLKMIDDFLDCKGNPESGRLEDTDLFKYFYSGRDKCKSYVRIKTIFGNNSIKIIIYELREMLARNTRFKFSFSHSDKYRSLDLEFYEWFRVKFNSVDFRDGNETFSLRKRSATLLSVLRFGRNNISEKELTDFLAINRELLQAVCEEAAIIEASYDASVHRDKYERAGVGKARRIIDSVNAGTKKEPVKQDAEVLMASLKNAGADIDSSEGLIINLASAEHTLTSLVIIDNCFIRSDGRKDMRNGFTDPMARFHYAVFDAGYVSRNGRFSEAFYIPDNSSYDRTFDAFRKMSEQSLSDLGDFDSIKAVRKRLKNNRPECFAGFLDETSGYALPEVRRESQRGRYSDSGAAFDELV